MPPSRSNLQRALGGGLAFDVGQVGVARAVGARRGLHAGKTVARIGLRGRGGGQKLRHHVEQMARAVHRQAGHQRGFFGAAGRQHQLRVDARLLQRRRHGQRAAHRAQLARQRQLAGKFPAGQPRTVDLPAGGQDAERNRQVEATRVLGQVGRRQVDGDALVVRKVQPAVLQRAAHALARFLDLDIGQPDQGEAGQAIGQMHLDRDGGRRQPQQGTALHQAQAHGVPVPVLVRERAAMRAPMRCS